MRKILLFLISTFHFSSAMAVELAGNHNWLSRVNWNGSANSYNGPAKVGGYLRGSSASYGDEALVKFDLSGQPQITNATFRFYVSGGTSGGDRTVNLFKQNLRSNWNPATVNYDFFCNSTIDCPVWSQELGSTTVNSATVGWVDISSPGLTQLVNEWISSPSSNNGLVLAGNFYYWGYAIDVSQFKLILEPMGGSGGGTGEGGGGGTTSGSTHTYTVTGSHFFLKQENWNGTYHQAGGVSRIGGYERYQPYGYETLAKFVLPQMVGQIVDAKVKFHVTGGNTGHANQVILYDQNKSNWDPTTVNYATFGNTPWTKALGDVQVRADQPGWYTLGGLSLVREVDSWIQDAGENQGLVLTGAFWHWDYYVNVDEVQLEVVTSEGAVGELFGYTAHARQYNFGAPNGNLVSNWSFENHGNTWNIVEGYGTGSTRFASQDIPDLCQEKCLGVSGEYVGKAVVSIPAGFSNAYQLVSDPIPVRGGQNYTLSYYYRGTIQGNAYPSFRYLGGQLGPDVGGGTGSRYVSSPGWTLHTTTFTAPPEARFVELRMFNVNQAGHGGTLYFDDVVLEEGDAASSRNDLQETVSFADALGRTHQTQSRIQGGSPNRGVGSSCLDDYILYSRSDVSVGDRTIVTGAALGAATSILIRHDSKTSGNLDAGTSVTLLDRARLDGNVHAGTSVSLGAEVVHNGAAEEGIPFVPCTILPATVSASQETVLVASGGDHSLEPGHYGDILLQAGGPKTTLYLKSGNYHFRTFKAEADVEIIFDLSGGPAAIYVQEELRLGARNKVMISEKETGASVTWHSNQTLPLTLGEDSRIVGAFLAPNATIEVKARVILEGGLYANKINVAEDAFLGQSVSAEISSGKKYMISETRYDIFGRPDTTFLPHPEELGHARFVPNNNLRAVDWYNQKFPEEAGKPRPFQVAVYAADPQGRIESSYMPGKDWGTRPVVSGFGFTDHLNIPPGVGSEDFVVVPPLSFGGGRECPYRVDWTRNEDSVFTLTWTDRRGQTIQSAVNKTRNTGAMNTWSWVVSKTAFHNNGQTQKSLTPLDVAGGTEGFRETNLQTVDGQVLEVKGPDRGLQTFWQNRAGQLRFSQDPELHTDSRYAYIDYDRKGRVVSQGTQSIYFMGYSVADLNSESSGDKAEQVGYLYDTLTGILTQLSHSPVFNLRNVSGRMAAKYHRNDESLLPDFDWERRLVADLYSYDDRGNVERIFKYVGPVQNLEDRYQRVDFEYDSNDRLLRKIVFDNAISAQIISEEHYSYDHLGRLVQKRDKDDENIVRFTFDDLGQITATELGTGSRIENRFALRGWAREIKASQPSSGKVYFQEFLGYNTKALELSQVPDLLNQSFSGRINQKVVKYGGDLEGDGIRSLKAHNFGYDLLGRMNTAQVYQNAAASGLYDSHDEIQWANVSLTASPDDAENLEYDDVGRIISKRMGNVSSADKAVYHYLTDSYRLGKVTGTLKAGSPRDMSREGNFDYDSRGSMTADSSKELDITYDYRGMPVRFRIQAGSNSEFFSHSFYNADGRRAASVETEAVSDAETSRKINSYIGASGSDVKELREDVTQGQTDRIVYLNGPSGVVGRMANSGPKEFFIKNYQGSTVRVVYSDGTYANRWAIDYYPDGDVKGLRQLTEPKVTHGYTGKEQDEALALLYFGARWLDPELGLWLVPDAAKQFANPYAYGGDPINGIDPDGNWLGLDDAIAAGLGAVVGYVGYGIATGDWWSWQALGMAAVGAAAGEGALYTGGATLSLLGPGIGAAAAAGAAGGAVGGAISGVGGYSVGAAAGDHSWNVGDASKAAAIGIASGAVGGAAGGVAAAGVGALASQIGAQSPVLVGGVAGAAGGYAGGAASTLIMGGSLAEANRNGLNGMALGAVSGAVAGYSYSKSNSINPWTGERNETLQIPVKSLNSTAELLPDETIQIQNPEVILPDRGSSKSIRQYTMSGGNSEAMRQFNSLPLKNIHAAPRGGLIGQMPSGEYVTYYPSSASGGRPTIVMQGLGKTVKVRFTP